MKIANAFMGASCFRLKFLNYRGGPGGATHGSAGNHADPIASYIADDRVLLGLNQCWIPGLRIWYAIGFQLYASTIWRARGKSGVECKITLS